MANGQYDLAHNTFYFILFLFVCLAVFGFVYNVYGEKQIDVYRTYLTLNDVFDTEKIMTCFSGTDYRFDESRFTDSILKGCTSRNVKITLKKSDGMQKIIGNKDAETDFAWKEYAALSEKGGVLTIEMEGK
mgnify:CR=1 FL=1